MRLRPSESEQSETAEVRKGTVQLTPHGWKKLDAKIAELHKAGATYLWIAGVMCITENTLRKLRREKDAYRTNLADLEGIFNIFNEGKSPQEICPDKNRHYTYVLKEAALPPTAAKFPLPYELQCFQGREQELQTLRKRFLAGESKQAISGLGGIGKTQLALKYAIEFQRQYKAVFWIHGETEESIRSEYARYARLLGLVEDETQEQEKTVWVFLRWLEASNSWLLILDNADIPEILHKYLPQNAGGHILLTTRARSLAFLNIHAQLPLEKLSEKASLQFLLARCNRLDANTDESGAAAALANELGHLPLALAHAAAYIAHKQTTFAHYLALFTKQKLALLEKASIPDAEAYLKPVWATWEINFRALEKELGADRPGAYARELLKFCAFVGADDIPCELVLPGAKVYCPPLYKLIPGPQGDADTKEFCGVEAEQVYHELLQPLLQYSLVTKSLEASPRFNIHRILQMVIADRLGDEKRAWQERAVQAVDSAFPLPHVENWRLCERLLSHAIAVADMARQERLTTQAVGRLLCLLGEFLMYQGQYAPAEAYARYALGIRETFASEHPLKYQYLPDLALSLHYLGNICHHQGKLAEAQSLLERALDIRLQHSAPNDPEITHICNDLAAVYNSRKLYSQAESIYRQLLATADTTLEANTNPEFHHNKAALCHNLGWACYGQGRYEEAARQYRKALAHWTAYGIENHPQHANTWHELAQTYREMGHADAAECYFNALQMQYVAYPKGHVLISVTLCNIAKLYKNTSRYDQAEEYYKKALEEDIKVNGKIHADVVFDLNALAELYRLMGRQADANETQRQIDALTQQIAEKTSYPNT